MDGKAWQHSRLDVVLSIRAHHETVSEQNQSSLFSFCFFVLFFSLYVCAVQDWEGYVLLNMFDKLLRDRVYLLYSFS